MTSYLALLYTYVKIMPKRERERERERNLPAAGVDVGGDWPPIIAPLLHDDRSQFVLSSHLGMIMILHACSVIALQTAYQLYLRCHLKHNNPLIARLHKLLGIVNSRLMCNTGVVKVHGYWCIRAKSHANYGSNKV